LSLELNILDVVSIKVFRVTLSCGSLSMFLFAGDASALDDSGTGNEGWVRASECVCVYVFKSQLSAARGVLLNSYNEPI
jgi:hypothetical protein